MARPVGPFEGPELETKDRPAETSTDCRICGRLVPASTLDSLGRCEGRCLGWNICEGCKARTGSSVAWPLRSLIEIDGRVLCPECRRPKEEELLSAEPVVSDELVELGAVLLHHWTRIRCVQLAVDAVDLGGQQKIEDVLVLAKEYERWITSPPDGGQDEEER